MNNGKHKMFGLRRGQMMLITVFILGSIMLGASALAGLITTYRVRQAGAAAFSAKALFAADAGLERALYQCFAAATPDCTNFNSDSLSPPFSNAARYDVTFISGTPNEIRSVGKAGRSSRSLRFRY